MFSQSQRVTRADFEGNKEFRTSHGSLFSLRSRGSFENALFSKIKVAVVVSKKVAKSSVLRHKIKRQALGALREIFNERSKRGVDSQKTVGTVIFFAKSQSTKALFQEIKTDMGNLLRYRKN